MNFAGQAAVITGALRLWYCWSCSLLLSPALACSRLLSPALACSPLLSPALTGMYCVAQCPDGVVPGENGQGACPGGMHELFSENGYLYCWLLMGFIGVACVVLFVLAGIIPLPWHKVWVSAHKKTEQAGQEVAAESSHASSGGSAPDGHSANSRAASRRERL